MDLALRPLIDADVEWIFVACQDPDIQRWTTVPTPYTRAHAEDFVATAPDRPWTWAVVERTADSSGSGTGTGTGTGDPALRGLAMASIHEIHPVTGEADAGYWVAPWARRRGVATWAVGQLVERARAMPEARSVALVIAAGNVASRRTAEAAGFTVVAEATEHAPDRRDPDRPSNDQLVAAVRYRFVLTDN